MRDGTRGGWPAGLIGMLALVAACEGYVAAHREAFTTLHAAAWRRSGEVVGKAARCPIVALGDSLVKHGFAANVAAEAAGRPAYNLAVPKGMFPGHDLLFRRLLAAGGRPEALVVDGEMMGEDPLADARIWSEMLGPAECAEIAWAGRDPVFLARAVLAAGLPTYRAREEVRRAVVLALEGYARPEPLALPIFWRNWRRNSGAELLRDRDDPPGPDPRLAQLDRENYRPVFWACHPLAAAYADRLLDRAAARGVRVFWLLPPYHPEVEARREAFGHYPQYAAYLHRMVERHPNLTVIDGRGAGYPPEVLADMTHLSKTGAVAYSAAVGRLIRDRLGAPAPAAGDRWVKLPRYDAAAAASALASASGAEDLGESDGALKRAAADARRERRAARLARAAAAGPERRRR